MPWIATITHSPLQTRINARMNLVDRAKVQIQAQTQVVNAHAHCRQRGAMARKIEAKWLGTCPLCGNFHGKKFPKPYRSISAFPTLSPRYPQCGFPGPIQCMLDVENPPISPHFHHIESSLSSKMKGNVEQWSEMLRKCGGNDFAALKSEGKC